MADDFRKVAAASRFYLAGAVLGRLIRVVIGPVLARMLAPAEFGLWALFQTACNLMRPLTTLCLEESVAIELADAHKTGVEKKGAAGTIWTLQVVLCAVSCVVLYLTGSRLKSALYPYAAPDSFSFLVLVLLFLWFTSVPLVLLHVYRIEQRPDRATAYEAVQGLLGGAALLIFVFFWRATALAAAASQAVAAAIFALACAPLLSRKISIGVQVPVMTRSFRYALPKVVHSFAIMLLVYFDRLVLQAHCSLSELGIYSLGYALGMVVASLGDTMAAAMGPVFFEVEGAVVGRERRLGHLSSRYCALLGLAAAGGVAFGAEAVEVIAGPAYRPAGRIIPWIILASFFYGLYVIPLLAVSCARETHLIPQASVPAALVNVGLNLWLVPRYGSIAAAWTTCISYGAMWAMLSFLGRRHLGFEWELSALLPAGALVVAGFALTPIGLCHDPASLTAKLLFALLLLWFLRRVLRTYPGSDPATDPRHERVLSPEPDPPGHAGSPKITVLHYTGCNVDRGGLLAVVRALASAELFECLLGVNPGFTSSREPRLPQVELPRTAPDSIDPASLWRARSVARSVRDWLRLDRSRVYHGHSRAGLLVGLWLNFWGESRVIVSVHCYGRRRWFYRFAARLLGDRIYWVSPSMRRYYGLPGDGWDACIPECTPSTAWTVRPPAGRGLLTIGAAGALVRWKGVHLVIEALALLPAHVRAQIRFLHIGSPDSSPGSRQYADAVRTRAVEAGLADTVEWRGEQPSTAGLMQEIDVLVVSSYREPFSMVMLEALQAGVPVLASDFGGPADVLGKGQLGWLFRSGDAQDLARMLELLTDPATRAAIHIDPEELSQFTAPVVATQWLKVYRRCLARSWAHD